MARTVARTHVLSSIVTGRTDAGGLDHPLRRISTTITSSPLASVDLNPTRACMIANAESYLWSSAAAHRGPSKAHGWLDVHTYHQRIPPADWPEHLAQPLPGAYLDRSAQGHSG